MVSNTNRWMRLRWRLWALVYDRSAGMFRKKRERSLELLNLQPGERGLIVGAGTGLDLELIPSGPIITAIDLTPQMIARLQERAWQRGLNVDARVMDGQALEFADGSFDAVILHLILSVVPDPIRCAKEAARVLRPGGRAVILDKFIADDARPSLRLRMLNVIVGILGTKLTRKLGPILNAAGLRIVHLEAAGLNGFLKIVLVQKD